MVPELVLGPEGSLLAKLAMTEPPKNCMCRDIPQGLVCSEA